MEDLHLPPELWYKVLTYLVANDGFYENPDLLEILSQIPEAVDGGIHGFVRDLQKRGYTYQDLDEMWELGRRAGMFPRIPGMNPARNGGAPMGEAYLHRDCIRFGVMYDSDQGELLIDISVIFTLDNNILIYEHIGYCGTLDRWRICRCLKTIYKSFKFLPFGSRMRMESESDPWGFVFIYPDEKEDGAISMRRWHVPKHHVRTSGGYAHQSRCYSRIDMRHAFPSRNLKALPLNEIFHSTYLRDEIWIGFAKYCGYAEGSAFYKAVCKQD
jgi:hypothetical protein